MITRADFTAIMMYLEAAVGKPIPAATLEVYYDLLGDYSAEVLSAAVKRAVLDSRYDYPTVPPVGVIRELADSITNPGEPSPAEAWGLARRAACQVDPDIPGSVDKVLSELPAIVAKAMRCFGVGSLCYGKTEVVRRQWLDIYEQLARSEKRQRLLPAGLRTLITNLAGNLALSDAELSLALTHEKTNAQTK
jgi:hypothetical protein